MLNCNSCSGGVCHQQDAKQHWLHNAQLYFLFWWCLSPIRWQTTLTSQWSIVFLVQVVFVTNKMPNNTVTSQCSFVLVVMLVFVTNKMWNIIVTSQCSFALVLGVFVAKMTLNNAKTSARLHSLWKCRDDTALSASFWEINKHQNFMKLRWSEGIPSWSASSHDCGSGRFAFICFPRHNQGMGAASLLLSLSPCQCYTSQRHHWLKQ